MIVKCENAFKDDDVGTIHRFGASLSRMSHEVVDWHIHFLSFLQPLNRLRQQLKVKSVGMVKIVFVFRCQHLFFCVKYLQ